MICLAATYSPASRHPIGGSLSTGSLNPLAPGMYIVLCIKIVSGCFILNLIATSDLLEIGETCVCVPNKNCKRIFVEYCGVPGVDDQESACPLEPVDAQFTPSALMVTVLAKEKSSRAI